MTLTTYNFDLTQFQVCSEKTKKFLSNSKSRNTQLAYYKDWKDFEEWCYYHDQTALPTNPVVVAEYLSDKASYLKASTLKRRITTIAQVHRLAGYPFDTKHPILSQTWAGIKRTIGSQEIGKSPLLVNELKEIIDIIPRTLIGIRDKALLLLGFTGAFRRSEVVSLQHENLKFTLDGLIVNLVGSKTDQDKEGRQIGIPFANSPVYCPVHSVKDWLSYRNGSGFVFVSINRHGRFGDSISDRNVPTMIKKYVYEMCRSKGYTHEEAKTYAYQFSGHSLRSGLVTSAAMAGMSDHTIMRQTGHKSTKELRKYIRIGNLFHNNAAASLGL